MSLKITFVARFGFPRVEHFLKASKEDENK